MEEMKHSGRLITFEGPDGGGKTTQIQMLAEYLRDRGWETVVSREPGGTGIGISIRNILLDPSFSGIVNRTELLLFLADRAQHVEELIVPALKDGKIVLCDRFVDSTVAYQVGGRGFSDEIISQLNQFATAGLSPDITFLLDVEYDIGIKRATRVYADRLEKEHEEFHKKIRKKYLEIAKQEPKRIHIIDTTKNHVEIVQKLIRQKLIESKCLG